VYGYLRIRIGAGWQLVFFPLFLLFLHHLSTIGEKELSSPWSQFSYFLPIALFLPFILSNVVGLLGYDNSKIFDIDNENITLYLSMFVNSIRYFFVLLFIYISLTFLKNSFRVNRAIEMFLFTSVMQGIYGIYEFLLKKNGVYSFILNEKAVNNITPRPFGTFYEPSQFGNFIIASILLYFVYISYAKIINHNSFLVKYRKIAIIILFMSAILSLSRSAFLSFAISIVILSPYFLFKKETYKIIFTIFGCLFLINLVYNLEFLLISYENSFRIYESSYENTVLNRVDSILTLMSNMPIHLVGVGVGVSDLLNMRVGAWFTYVYDLGMINFLFVGIIILNIFKSIITVRNKQLKYTLLLLHIYMVIILFSYDSYLHLWIWFLFIIMYIISSLLAKKVNNLI
jgi:hypothetical protein